MSSLYQEYTEELSRRLRLTFDLLHDRNSKYRGRVDLNKANLIVGRYHEFSGTTEVLGFKVLLTDNLGSHDYVLAIHDANYAEEEWLKIFHNDT